MQLISQSKTERNFRICKLVYSYAMFEIREADARSQVFFKKGVFKNFENFTGKQQLCWTLFLINFQGW